MEDEQYIESGLSVGVMKIYETLSKEEIDAINNKISELDERVDDIEDTTNDINNKISELDERVDDIEDKKADKSITDDIQRQINSLVLAGDGTQNLEVVQARGDYSVLNDRLNVFDKKFDDILEEEKTNIELTTSHYFTRLTETGVLQSYSGRITFEVSVSANEIYYLNIYAKDYGYPYLAFHDINGNVLSMMKAENLPYGGALLENIKIIIPLNCVKILFTTGSDTDSYTSLVKVEKYDIKNMNKMLEDINNLNNSIEDNFETLTLSWNAGKMYNRDTGIMEELSNCYCVSIDVSEGETYNVKATGYGQANPYIILNSNNSKISAYPDASISYPTNYDVTVTIPVGGAKLLLNCRTNDSSLGIISKKNGVLPLGVRELKENMTNVNKELEFYRKNYEKAIIAEQLKNDFEWNDFDKIYITFTFDDSNSDISDIETLFAIKKVPCCYATIPSRLDNITNSGEKVRDVLARAVTNGGEVLSHWHSPLTSTSTEEDYFDVYVRTKKTLTEAGFDVNGIIVSDGPNYDTQDWIKGVMYARPYYRYSDLVGKTQDITQYNHSRKFLTSDDATNKSFIDTAISQGNQWVSFASRGTNDDVTIYLLSSLLDYIATKSNVEIVNFKYLYDTFGTTKLEKRLIALENK